MQDYKTMISMCAEQEEKFQFEHFSREDAAFKNEMAPGGVPEAIAKKSHKKTFTLNCCD